MNIMAELGLITDGISTDFEHDTKSKCARMV